MLSPRLSVAAPEDNRMAGRAPPRPAALTVSRVVLTDYRCYAGLNLEVDPRPVVLTGPNGAGKTNLLEAISFLSPGRGLRRDRLAQVGRRGAAGPWSVAAELSTPAGIVEIGTGLAAPAKGGAPERRVVKIDGRRAAGPAALAGVVAIGWLTPEMDRLFLEGASGRRPTEQADSFRVEPAFDLLQQPRR